MTGATLHQVAVIGGGYMGAGIAQVLAAAGRPVQVCDTDTQRSLLAVERIQAQAADFGRRGLFTPEAARRVVGNVTAAATLAAAVERADLIVEAVSEDVATKRDVLSAVESAAPETAVMATNTSSIPVATLSAGLRRPERFLGAHWFNPAQFVPAVEIVPGPVTEPAAVAAVTELLRSAGKSPTTVGDCAGFVGNRLQFALFLEAVRVLEEGVATAEEIDAIVRGSFGFRLPFFGPFAVADMAGLDVYSAAYASLEQAYGSRFATPTLLIEAIASGRRGVKSGAGLLDRSPDEWAAIVARRDESYAALQGLLGVVDEREAIRLRSRAAGR